MPNQGKLLKTKVSSENNATYLELRTYLGQKKPVLQIFLFIAIYFYRNILCKNIACDMGLSTHIIIWKTLPHHFVISNTFILRAEFKEPRKLTRKLFYRLKQRRIWHNILDLIKN